VFRENEMTVFRIDGTSMFSEVVISIYQTKWPCISIDGNVYNHCHENSVYAICIFYI